MLISAETVEELNQKVNEVLLQGMFLWGSPVIVPSSYHNKLRFFQQVSNVDQGSGASVIGIWENGITGIALMIGAAVLDGGQMVADIPAGWYFALVRTQGSNSTIVNAFTQSLV